MRLSPLFAALALAACSQSPSPQSASPISATPAQAFVIAANPQAAEAGREVLARGGSAADAALAVQAMLSLVEPQSSGMGGGAFLNYYDAVTRRLSIYDGREVAPAQATASMFLGADGKPLPFSRAVLSGRATGVPGAVAALAEAHSDHGKLPWRALFGAAQRTAANGFVVSPRLARMIAGKFPQNGAPDVQAYFGQGPGGKLVEAGDTLRNPAYADFLGRLSAGGPRVLYTGETAARIVERLRQGELPGSMTMADLAAYRPVRREALCRPWQGYSVCVPPPPSSGVGLLELLGLLERTDIAKRGPKDPQSWFLFAEASRLMYADRDRYVADPAFVDVPVEGLLQPAYLDARVRLIRANAMSTPEAGSPAGARLTAADFTQEPAGTSHFIVGDADGNVMSVTTTVESIFGSGRMDDGFVLNNQLTDFSFDPKRPDGGAAANAVAGGKKPRSSMVPAILLTPDGRFAGAIGSAGGNAILAFLAKSLVASVMWGEPMQQALAEPNLVARGSSIGGEIDKFSPAILDALRARGVDVKPGQGEDSGVHGVLVREGRIDGGYDPRREGRVIVLPSRSPR